MKKIKSYSNLLILSVLVLCCWKCRSEKEVVIDHFRFNEMDRFEALISANPSLLNDCYFVGDPNVDYTLLSLSAKFGDLERLSFLIDKGADLEVSCSSKTPLMYAIKYGNAGCVHRLLEAGANPNFITSKRMTALDYAVKYKHEELAIYFVKKRYQTARSKDEFMRAIKRHQMNWLKNVVDSLTPPMRFSH